MSQARFTGFPPDAMTWFESVQGVDRWPEVEARRAEHDRLVREPLTQLCAELEAAFGPAYVWKLHRSQWMWSNQVATVDVADTIGFAVTLSLDDLCVSGGWARSSGDQVRRFDESLAGSAGAGLVAATQRLRQRRFELQGRRLARAPRGAPADAARAELARYRTLVATRGWPIGPWLHSRTAVRRVRQGWSDLEPLVHWLADNVGPRQRHPT